MLVNARRDLPRSLLAASRCPDILYREGNQGVLAEKEIGPCPRPGAPRSTESGHRLVDLREDSAIKL